MTRLPSLVALALAAALLVGCGSDSDGAGDSSTYGAELQHSDFDPDNADDYNALLELPDGRKVAMFYDTGKGLAEQHYSPEADAWTAPEIIYETDQDPCQGISIVADGGTVAVTADWALYCYDGEPPNESIAGVATGDLTDWETDLTEGFDGWASVRLSDSGTEAVWTYHGSRLTWTTDGGFDKELED